MTEDEDVTEQDRHRPCPYEDNIYLLDFIVLGI